MVRHRLKTIALIEIDCGWLRINYKANATNLTGNASCPVNGIKEHKLPNAFSTMTQSCRQPPKPKGGNPGR